MLRGHIHCLREWSKLRTAELQQETLHLTQDLVGANVLAVRLVGGLRTGVAAEERPERAVSVSFARSLLDLNQTAARLNSARSSAPDSHRGTGIGEHGPLRSSLRRPSTAGTSTPGQQADDSRTASHYSASTSRAGSLEPGLPRGVLRRPNSAHNKAPLCPPTQQTRPSSPPSPPAAALQGIVSEPAVSLGDDKPPDVLHNPLSDSITKDRSTTASPAGLAPALHANIRGSLPPEFYESSPRSDDSPHSRGLSPTRRRRPQSATATSLASLDRQASLGSQASGGLGLSQRLSLSGNVALKLVDRKASINQALTETIHRRQLAMAGHGGGETLSRKQSGGLLSQRQSLESKKLMLGSLKEAPSLYDGINLDVLLKTKEIFAQADIDKGGDVDMEEFIRAFSGVLTTEDGGGPEALRKLFMRIDANADGSVDWNEFSAYMLLESDGAASLRDDMSTTVFAHPTVKGDIPEAWPHKAIMTSIAALPAGRSGERYATTGRDGTIRLWNCKDLAHARTIHCGEAWLTASLCTPVSKLLCVSSFARELRIYDPQTMDVFGTVPELEFSPLTLDAWKQPGPGTLEKIVMGDVGGVVTLFNFTENLAEPKKGPDRWGLTRLWRQKLHTDWVTRVRHIPELSCVLSCSLDSHLCLADLDRRAATRSLQGHTSGVNAVDWSHLYKFIASGSLDKRVLLWNPYAHKPMAALTGHMASVVDVVVNDRNNQIISLSADKTIKVWDIRNHRCMQTLIDGEACRKDEHRPAFLMWDQKRKWLIAGAVRPKAWPLETVGPKGRGAHIQPVVCALYNTNFGEVVSGDNSGTVCVWNAETGELKFRFGDAHGSDRITAMSFDLKARRLITGSDRGSVKVWNFSNGACLKELSPVSKQDITGIVCLKANSAINNGFFVSVGWDRRITFYPDRGAAERQVKASRSIPEQQAAERVDDSMRPTNESIGANTGTLGPTSTTSNHYSSSRRARGHSADILTVAHQLGTAMLATGGYDGQIVVWNTDSGMVTRIMTAPDCQERPYEERAVEKVNFLSGNLWYVLVAVGADGWLRFWDAMHGRLLLECNAGHKVEESLLALCASPDNSRLVTGDSAGYIKLWDISVFAAMPRHATEVAPQAAVKAVHIWRGHTQALTSLDWVSSPISGVFIVSASTDKRVALWSENGSHVGDFGRHTWKCLDPTSWHRVVNRKVVGEELDTPRSIAASDVVGLTPRSRDATPRSSGSNVSASRWAGSNKAVAMMTTMARATGALQSPHGGSDPGGLNYGGISDDEEECLPEELQPIQLAYRKKR
ncbi:hypothetical protein WJX72_000893 [[Myrmecia] bisecta]|uniref:EF-hand domain-containing protein n=1 Tax=[Myrmecia] bisecta TaxID=41462 RepID=A0AAW1Q3R5_9CHLO